MGKLLFLLYAPNGKSYKYKELKSTKNMFKRLVVFAVIFLIGVAPMIAVAVAGSIANSHGCTLNEGSIHPCIVDGEDMGKTLYTYAMMGWFAIATIPLAFGMYVIWFFIEIILYIRRRQKRVKDTQVTPASTSA